MAELAGIVVGGVALASLYSTCLDAIASVRIAKSFGASYENCLLRLDILELRLSRWGESVRIIDNPSQRPRLEVPAPSPKDVETVKRLLGAIQMAFEDAKKLSERYSMKAPKKSQVQQQTFENDESIEGDSSSVVSLHQKVRDLVRRRQRGTSRVQIAKWAMYEEKEFEKLVDNVSGLVTSLIELFPAVKTAQKPLCEIEVSELVEEEGKESMILLRDTSRGVDSVLEETISEAGIPIELSRQHRIHNIKVTDDARVLLGDEVADGAEVTGYGHSYDGIFVTGKAKAQTGNRYGGKSFWDD
jgi:hypothetical protein